MVFVDRVPVGELRARIEREVPLGSSVAEISQFLESEGVAHSGPHTAAPSSILLDRGVEHDRLVITAMYQDTGPRWDIGVKSIAVGFLLGADLRLEEVILVPGRTFL